MKKSISSSSLIITVICILFFSVFISSCAPKSPKPPRLYSTEDVKYHPKDANGVPKGYKIVYSRTGINSIDYVKESDLAKYDAQKKAYDEYKREKVLKEEYDN